MRVALIGAGKRMLGTYVPVLKKINDEIVGFMTRTDETANAFNAATNVSRIKTLGELYKLCPDYIIVCVPPAAVSQCVRPLLSSGIPILIETPIEDFTLLEAVHDSKAVVGVLEQWPYLPLEQFKAKVYEKGLISRPFLVKNDSRSYDYHAIAQLRSYIGRDALPTLVKGTQIVKQLKNSKDNPSLVDAWDIAHVTFNNGAVLCHEFSYACKVAPFRSIQTLRAYSDDGTIVTGRIFDKNNDYEIIDVECLSRRLEVNSVFDDKGVAWSLNGYLDSLSPVVTWERKDFEASSDAEIAIATHLFHMRDVVQSGSKPLYDIKDATMDRYIMMAIKQACAQGTTLQLG